MQTTTLGLRRAVCWRAYHLLSRAGAPGQPITLVTADEVRLIRRYESELGIVVRHVDIREGRLVVAYDRE